jgi:uncharacterized protein (TIGR02246 family)
MRSRFLSAIALLTLLLLSENGQAANLSVEEQKIRELDRQWVAAVARKDAVATASYYARDGALLAPNAPIAEGTSAITAAWQKLLNLKNLDLTFAPTKIVVSGAADLAYETGTYALSFDSDKGPMNDRGKYVVAWRKVDGVWKAAADIFNSNGPAS